MFHPLLNCVLLLTSIGQLTSIRALDDKRIAGRIHRNQPARKIGDLPVRIAGLHRAGINRRIHGAGDLAIAIDSDRLPYVKFHPQSRQAIAADNHRPLGSSR